MIVKSSRERRFEEVQKGFLNFLNISFGVDAGTEWPFVENADHRDGIGILDAARQIEFAGNRHNGFGSVFHNNSSRQRPSGCHRDLHLVLVRQFDQVLDLTLPTSFAVLDISGDLDLAVEILDAMRKQKKESTGPYPVMVRSDEMVVEFNEGLLNLLLRHPYDFSHQDHEGKKDLCHDSPQSLGEEDVFASEDGEDKEKPTGEHKENEDGKDEAVEEG